MRASARSGRLGEDADVQPLFSAGPLEAHTTADLREQGVIHPDAHVRACAHGRAALPNKDIACQHLLATEALYAQALGMRVTTVAGTTACFLMCHGAKSSSRARFSPR